MATTADTVAAKSTLASFSTETKECLQAPDALWEHDQQTSTYVCVFLFSVLALPAERDYIFHQGKLVVSVRVPGFPSHTISPADWGTGATFLVLKLCLLRKWSALM